MKRARWRALGAAMFALGSAAGIAAADSTSTAGQAETAGAARRIEKPVAPDDPVSRWSKVLSGEQATAQATLRFRALMHRAEAYQAAGRIDPALRDFHAALALAQDGGEEAQVALASGGLGNAYWLRGANALAQTHLEGSIAQARRAGRPDIEALGRIGIGNLLDGEGDSTGALTAYREGESLARRAGNDALIVQAATNAARSALALGDRELARSMLSAADEHCHRMKPSTDKAYALIAIARLTQRGGAPARGNDVGGTRAAVELLSEARDLGRALPDRRVTSFALGYLGERYEKDGRHEEARRLTAEALFLAQELNAAELEYRWHWQLGRIARAQGDRDGAIGAFRSAANAVRSVQPNVMSTAGGDSRAFRAQVKPVFDDLVAALIERARAADRPEIVQAYLIEARDSVERLKSAELQDYFRDDCVVAARASVQPLEQVAPRTAVIYPIFLHDRIELLLSSAQGIRQASSPVALETLSAEVDAFRDSLRDLAGGHFLPHARRLYDWLVRPLEEPLRVIDADTLVFVPDGPLRTIPLAALHDGADFLLRRYGFVISPGLTLIDVRPFRAGESKALLGGLTQSVQGFPALPKVGEELDAIQAMYSGKRLQDEAFVASNLEREVGEHAYGVVHIATHARFEREARDSFVLTHDGKLSLRQLEDLLGAGQSRARPIELLSLSACQTALGDERAALGLAGVSVKAGASSALATLWDISDEAAAILLPEFYRQLADPAAPSKAAALRNAQMKLMSDERFAHPGFWSPFLLIGNWL